MKYISTRGKAPKLNFEQVLLQGLASDGGLYLPEEIPQFTPHEIAAMAGLPYSELAKIIISPFVTNSIPKKDLDKIIDETYKSFSHSAVVPLKQLNSNLWLLELFHGPTLAFKDFALQLLGRLLDYTLKKRRKKAIILGATSGDTGSAAIAGCRHCKNAKMFILHPKGRTSEIQRRQMTTVISPNIHNIALKGNFDDCQNIVKSIFADREFLGDKLLIAVNSINWARIMAQIVYYFYAAVSLGSPAKSVSFSVPTGNFGDIFAGFMAHKMGLPVSQLIVATNKNDILSRFINDNDYSSKRVVKTLSPSMDIQISSNFERLLFYAHDSDAAKVNKLMEDFKTKGGLSVAKPVLHKIKSIFSGLSVDDKTITKVIKNVFEQTGELIDPHTATGIKAAQQLKKFSSDPMVVLATAHPAKFPDAARSAGVVPAILPNCMKDLMKQKEKYVIIEDDIDKVKEAMSKY